jgi:hypothetical protein
MRTIPAFLILFLLAACIPAKPTFPANPYDRTRPADCVPLPPMETPDPRPPTATPDPSKYTPHPPRPTDAVTATSWPTPYWTDLSPYMRYEDKIWVWVYRCDGTEETFLVDPAFYPTAIPLGHGGIILMDAPPASIMGVKPPDPPTSTATPFQPKK